MTYGGTLSGDGLTVGAVPYRDASLYEIQAGGGNVDLFVPALGTPGDDTLQHWQGGDGTWNAANEKWLNQGGNTLVSWAGNHAVFKNEPGGFDGGAIAVEGTQGFKGLQFVDSGYRLEGSGTLEVDGSDSAGGSAEIRVLAGETANIATTIGGTGGIAKTQGGTLTLNGVNTYTGLTTVDDGKLIVGDDSHFGASIAGAVAVATGGTLGGIGTVGDTTVASGGIVAPGNSPGTLHVAGSLLLSSGSIYDAEILANGVSDQIAVTGMATVSGSQVAVATLDPETSYRQGQSYTILTADGGVKGAFADVTSTSAFLDFTLDAKPNEVDLTIGIKAPPVDPGDPGTPPLFEMVAHTRNQKATAGALDTLAQSGPSLALYNDLLMLDAASARAAFDGLSGEIHASIKTGLIDDSRFVRDAANERLRAAFDGVGADKASAVLAYGPDGAKEPAPADTSRLAAWGSAFGSWSDYDGNGNASGMDTSTGGFVTGLDGLVAETWRLGLLAGYSHSSFDVDNRSSSGESDTYHLGVYGGTQWNSLSFRSGLAYSWHSIDTSRHVTFPGFDERLSGDYDAGTFQAFGELGYRIDTTMASFEPFANLAHVRLHTDGFDEDGGAAALSANSQTTDTTFTTLGLRASSSFTLGGMATTARGMLGWKHAFGDVTPVSRQAFTGSDAFTIAGVPLAQDSAIIEAGLDIAISKSATLGIAYNGQFGNGNAQNGVNATLEVKF
jgi:outer membrane autotransporter protein